MSSSPRLELIEKVRDAAAKKLEMASEALLTPRETGEGPIFNDDQNANLAPLCKQKGVDPAEFLAAYTLHNLHQIYASTQSHWPRTGGLC